ncbi:MAG: hypothetical protein AAGK66_05795 [Pseudomonadota bacterium]
MKPAFTEVKISPRCAMPRAKSDDHIAYIRRYAGGYKTPLAHAYKAANERGTEFHKRFDVVVTRTDKPVYLILDSYDAIMWNIVAAPGAKISGIGVMSYEGSSLANLPEKTKIGFLAFRGVKEKKCFNRAQGSPLTAEESAARALEINRYEADARDMEKWRKEHELWKTYTSRWIPLTFGGQIDENLYPMRGDGDMVYVGPIPEEPFELTAVKTIHVPDSIYPAWGTRDEVLAEFDAIARKELDALLN